MAEVSQIRVRGTLYDIKDTVARRGSGSSPAVASTAAGMIDTSKIYVYTGSETGYTAGNWYYYDGTSWVSGGIYQSSGIETDTTLAVSGAAADSKATGDAINNIVYVGSEVQDSHTQMLVSPTTSELEIVTKTEFDTELSDLRNEISQKSGLSEDVKQALLEIALATGYNDGEGQTHYDRLYDALYPPTNLSYITAVYTQSGTVYNTDSLDSLKTNLVVTAHYTDGSSEPITTYALSGELEDGTSTITVSYNGKTTTFNVTVVHIINGWYYPFNGSLLSEGTQDFGWTGAENYTAGRNTGEQAYYHKVNTLGDASTDQFGLKAIGIPVIPDFSGDFTVAFWFKSTLDKTGHPFMWEKVFTTGSGNQGVLGNSPTNVKSGYTVTKNNVAKQYGGCIIQFVSSIMEIRLSTNNGSYGCNYKIESFPSAFDSTDWHHYALTRSGTNIYFFIDGEAIFTASGITGTIAGFDNIALGNHWVQTVGNTELNPGGNEDTIQDLYVGESCKWTSDFDPETIRY